MKRNVMIVAGPLLTLAAASAVVVSLASSSPPPREAGGPDRDDAVDGPGAAHALRTAEPGEAGDAVEDVHLDSAPGVQDGGSDQDVEPVDGAPDDDAAPEDSLPAIVITPRTRAPGETLAERRRRDILDDSMSVEVRNAAFGGYALSLLRTGTESAYLRFYDTVRLLIETTSEPIVIGTALAALDRITTESRRRNTAHILDLDPEAPQ